MGQLNGIDMVNNITNNLDGVNIYNINKKNGINMQVLGLGFGKGYNVCLTAYKTDINACKTGSTDPNTGTFFQGYQNLVYVLDVSGNYYDLFDGNNQWYFNLDTAESWQINRNGVITNIISC